MTNQNRHHQSKYLSFQGIVTNIHNQDNRGCTKLFQVQNQENGIVHFVVSPDTYVIDQVKIERGMNIIGFYDANAPTILIYPPQYQALVLGVANPWQNIKVDRFGRNLVSQDQTLKLNITGSTDIILENGQEFTGSLANKDLIVIYSASTRSIPAQTTPERIIVMC